MWLIAHGCTAQKLAETDRSPVQGKDFGGPKAHCVKWGSCSPTVMWSGSSRTFGL